MAWLFYNGIYVRGAGGAAWTPAKLGTKVLFWGKVSEISGGQMPNKVIGATDYITVAGSPATYQVPNTAAYISADTDYIWFKQDSTQRTTTEAELVGYDLPRTPVKYDNNSPYTIREIIILKSGETLSTDEENNMRNYMQLSIWWSGTLSFYGDIKGNKLIAQKYTWTPETITYLYDTFTDTNGVHLHDHTMEVGAGWTAPVGLTIQSNSVKSAASASAIYIGVAQSNQANIDITANITFPNTTFYYAGVVLRYLDDSNKIYITLQRDNVAYMKFQLIRDSNTHIQDVDVTHVSGTRIIRVVANGTNVKCYLDGNLLINQTVTQHATETKHGIIQYRDANYNDTYILDFVAKSV